MYTYSFEKLDIWNESKEFTKKIYFITSNFPDAEKFGLTSQIRRTSVSICSNIAEGSVRRTYKDKANFTTMAFNSAIEVLNQLIICKEINLIYEEVYPDCRLQLESMRNKLNSLWTYQSNKQINE